MLKFKFTLKGDEGTKEFTAGRSSLWKATEEGAKLPDSPVKSAKQDYMWVYFAAQQNGLLAELGVPDGASIGEAIDILADSYDYDIEQAKDDAPLASAHAK